MSLDNKSEATGKLTMVLVREGEEEHAIALVRHFKISGSENSAKVSLNTLRDESEYYEIEVEDADDVEPKGSDMSLVEKLALRFTAAAERGTNVDLRFCSGEESLRKVTQDNLRSGYKSSYNLK